jgi:molybdopterin-guanine dinucleotide biosynthesis protein A
MTTTTGVILTGGRATRMGTDKTLVPFRGEPMITHVATALADVGLDVLVVGREIPGFDSISDLPGVGSGPLAGLLTALVHTAGDVLLVAVDQPLLRPATAHNLLKTAGDAVVPVSAGHPQVTCAVYRAACRRPAEKALAGGERKLRRLLDHVGTTFVAEPTWSAWGEDGRSWLSLDTPRAVRDAEALR